MKKTLIFAAALTGLSLANTALADVRLMVDDHIKVTAINGKTITQSPFKPLQQQFTLTAGRHVITAKYDRLYENTSGRGTHDYVRSDNITVTADMQDNQTYRLSMPNAPERYSDAKEYAKSPTLAIVHGSTIVAQESTTSDSGGLLGSIGSLFGRGDATLDNQRVIAAVQTQSPTATAAPAANRSNADTLDQFMQLWMNASDAEREKIRQWVK